jgi:membrane-bound lytic murein transglycosylase A
VDDGRLVPYHDRGDIDFGPGLSAEAEILGYLDDPVDVFFLHVQGSGTLVFADGERVRAGYASKNGLPYRSIGRLLLDEEIMTVDEMSMQAIKTYLHDNPDEVERVLSHNPSYVFFRPLTAEGGPLGCFGVPVTAGRSIATDRRLFPAPTAAFLTGRIPSAAGGDKPFSRLVVIEDTGGAITGPGRVDLFFGAGDEAGELAGRTKHLGELYFLLPRR